MSVILSCKPRINHDSQKNEPESINIVANFPVDRLTNLSQPLSQHDLETVVTDGQAGSWTKISEPESTQEILIRNQRTNNSIRFVTYPVGLVGVQQENDNVVTTEVWKYQPSNDAEEHWHQYPFRNYKLNDFFDERVVLPQDFDSLSATTYLSYEFGSASIIVSIDRWKFMRAVEGNINAPDPTLIKYQYALDWNGNDFR